MSQYNRSPNSKQSLAHAHAPRASVDTRGFPQSVRDLAETHIRPILLKNVSRGTRVTAVAILEFLCEEFPGRFDKQLRTTQRLVRDMRKDIRGLEERKSKPPEIYFRQVHPAGEEAQLDCTAFASLGITINGDPPSGKIFTFKLSFSGWIFAVVIKGEQDQAVMDSIQAAIGTLGGVPQKLRSDNGKALFKRRGEPTRAFKDLCDHYGTEYDPINPGRPHENGCAETGNKTVKGLLRNRLLTDIELDLDFPSLAAVDAQLKDVLAKHNARIEAKLEEERQHLQRLPSGQFETHVALNRKVGKEGMITIGGNYYSAPPAVHGKQVEVRKYNHHLTMYNDDGTDVKTWPLLPAGRGEFTVDYHDIIHWLKRKPGAFDGCVYRERLFPSQTYREAYQAFKGWYPVRDAARLFVGILDIAAASSTIEDQVGCALDLLMDRGGPFGLSEVLDLVGTTAAAKECVPPAAQLSMGNVPI